MRTPLLPLLAACALLCGTLPSAAQDAPTPDVPWNSDASLPDINPVQVPLDGSLVERFVASIPRIVALSRALDGAAGLAPAASNPEAASDEDLSFLLARHLFDMKSEQRINQELAAVGFSDYAQWSNTAHSVAIAVEAASFGRAVDLGSQKAAALRDVENDKALDDETRQTALAEIESQFAALAEFEPLPGNVEAVRPYLAAFKAARAGG